MVKYAHIPHILAFHLQTHADPDPTFQFDADADPDPTFQFDADPYGLRSTGIKAKLSKYYESSELITFQSELSSFLIPVLWIRNYLFRIRI